MAAKPLDGAGALPANEGMEPAPQEIALCDEFICAAAEVIGPRTAQPELRQMLELWEGHRRRLGHLPARQDFSPEALRFVLGNVVLFDVEGAPRRFRYRLFGSAFTFARGFDMTGKYLEEHPDAIIARLGMFGMNRLCDSGQPLLIRFRFQFTDGMPLDLEIVALPLAQDGRKVDMILLGQINRPLSPDEAGRPTRKVEIRCDATPAIMPLIHEPRLGRLLGSWEQWRGARRLPARRDFMPEQFGDLLGHLFLFDVVGEPPRFRYRVFGSRVAEFRGFDLTGQYIDQHPDAAFGTRAHQAYSLACRERKPLWARVDARGDSGMSFRFEALILPLAGDGERPDMVLSAQIMD